MLSTDVCRQLAGTFARNDYTVDAVVALIGEDAHRSLGRNHTVAAERALDAAVRRGEGGPLATLTRLWLLQRPVERAALEAALPDLVEPLLTAGLLSERGSAVVAEVDVRPYASDDGAAGWVVSDLSPSLDTQVTPMRPDFVLGVSSASSTLAQLTLRTPVGRALDLGTGCGVQSLHLARHADVVVATDLNPRAVELARLTAALNGVEVDFRLGDLYAPVAGETFDLVVSNPPYVMSPPTGERLTYREGTLEADGLVEQVVRQGLAHLNDGGVLQVLANWAHVRGQDWRDRVGGWLADVAGDVHVVEREVLDPYEYVELWLADAGLTGAPDYRERYAQWCDYLDDLGIEGVGMGWIVLRRTDATPARRLLESWPYGIEQPVAPALTAELAAIDTDRTLDDDAVLARCWRLAPDVVEETEGVPGEADPSHIVLRQRRGLRRAVQTGTALGGVLGACDGELALGRIVTAVAGMLDVDEAALRVETVAQVRGLAVDGLLL